MDKLLIAFAAAALAVGISPAAEAGFIAPLSVATSTPSLVHKSGCEDECEEYMEERAAVMEERAAATEEAVEEGYAASYAPRRHAAREERAAPSDRRARAEAERGARAAKSATQSEGKSAAETNSAKKDAEAITKPAPAKSTDANSTIASTVSRNCKQYFASVGMTASVPCE